MSGHRRNIRQSLPKRRQLNREDSQAVQKILSKSPSTTIRRDRGGWHPTIRTSTCLEFFTSHPLELAVLKNAKQSHLGSRGQFAALVKKQGPAVGSLKTNPSFADLAGEATSFVTEQFRVNKLWRNGAAIHAKKRTVGPA